MLATVFGIVATFWAIEHQAYQFGTTAKFNQGFHQANEAFRRTAGWASGAADVQPNPRSAVAIGVGFATTLLLFTLRLRYFGFPFHPIGYAISTSWAIHLVWLPLFIGWLFKGLTMHYGGLKWYRQFVPFFLGLILGDCVMGSVWALLGSVLNVRTYNFFGA